VRMTSNNGANSSSMDSFHLQVGEGRLRVEALVVVNGRDLVITIGGGDGYHIGATALAVPRPSLADPHLVSASASVLCVTGHKEDELARVAALKLAAGFERIVSVNLGLHVDAATAEDIDSLTHNFHILVDEIACLPL